MAGLVYRASDTSDHALLVRYLPAVLVSSSAHVPLSALSIRTVGVGVRVRARPSLLNMKPLEGLLGK